MKTEWDYTTLADAYLLRPDYSNAAIDAMLSIADMEKGDSVCDVGAGVAHLTLMLANRLLNVTAVEPNDAMRANGINRTLNLDNVRWYEGTGEQTGQNDNAFEMVTFGSSFNVCNREAALKEAARILKPKGWFACMWNHRLLDDPIQAQIESIIKSHISGYGYGSRREDQVNVINQSELFNAVVHLDSIVIHEQTIAECVEAWRSHATLERQAKETFGDIILAIENYLLSLNTETIEIPYSTNIWVSQLKS
jgi:ubiquinone/menaquinone biosynthesis C-methylase UbiE